MNILEIFPGRFLLIWDFLFFELKEQEKKMIDIAINNMSKAYYSKALFEEISLEVKSGERIGLLGDNGVGKTTLFKIITEVEPYNSGDLFIRKDLKIGLLQQTPPAYDHATVIDVLMEAFSELMTLKEKMRNLENKMSKESENINIHLEAFGKIQEIYEINGGYGIEEKLSKITKGMDINEEMQKKKYNVLSGGEKNRVMLAKILLEAPDTLLLDEPTNHLDIETSEWLEEYLKVYEGSALIISHDRYFLDQVVNKIYEINNGQLDTYFGNYSYYLEERELRYEQALRHYNAQQRKVKQMEKAATRMRDWASRADNEAMYVRAKAMERRIEKTDLLDQPKKDKINFSITFDANRRSGKEVVRAENYQLKILDQVLVDKVDFTLIYGERAALIGNNGTGKSTLIKDILKAADTEVQGLTVNPSAKIGYLQQDITFESSDMSILDVFKSYMPGLDGEIRSYLARFEFPGEAVFASVGSLSGGEKVRLKLAILMKQDINFLVLDEPTNHIDIKTRKVLEEALETFKGTILYVSHDRYFLDQFSDRIMAIHNQRLTSYFGNYGYYKRKKEMNESKVIEISETNEEIKKEYRKERKKKINPYKVEIYEKKIEDLEIRIEKKHNFINKNPTAYVKIKTAVDEIKNLEIELEKILEEYYGYLELFESNNG